MNSHDPNQIPVAGGGPARQLFERASARLDIATANRLRLMRRDAQARPGPRRGRSFLPMGATAAALLALGLAWWLPGKNLQDSASPVALEAAQAAYIGDDDAEVYAWLGDAPVATDNEPAGAL